MRLLCVIFLIFLSLGACGYKGDVVYIDEDGMETIIDTEAVQLI